MREWGKVIDLRKHGQMVPRQLYVFQSADGLAVLSENADDLLGRLLVIGMWRLSIALTGQGQGLYRKPKAASVVGVWTI